MFRTCISFSRTIKRHTSCSFCLLQRSMSEAKKTKKPIVIVTGNKNKLAEFKQILGEDFPHEAEELMKIPGINEKYFQKLLYSNLITAS